MHQIFVISDLHLGGRPAVGDVPGFEICPPESRKRLARFIHAIAEKRIVARSEDTIELVINGDSLDFLTEEPFRDFTGSQAEAIDKLDSIVRTADECAPEGERVFDAIREFVARGHKLTILLGNHDLELSLPEVRRRFFELLTQSKPARIEFLFDGEAHACGDVLIEHGNRYDGWNTVPMGLLRAYRSSASRNESPWPFAPPAGSRLVTEVMNPLKTRYRFVDLLKPENETVLPILCALEPELIYELKRLVPLWLSKRAAQGKPGRVRQEETFIATGSVAPSGEAPERKASPGQVLDDDRLDPEAFERTEHILADMQNQLGEWLEKAPGKRVPLPAANIGDGALAWMSSGLSLWRLRRAAPNKRYEILAKAFAAHQKSLTTTFDLKAKDPPYSLAAERLIAGSSFRIVVFGHTHLAKAFDLDAPGVYINTGTWCHTIQLDPRFYTGQADEATIQKMKDFVGDVAENKLDDWVKLQTHFAHLEMEADRVRRVALCQFHQDETVSRLFEKKML